MCRACAQRLVKGITSVKQSNEYHNRQNLQKKSWKGHIYNEIIKPCYSPPHISIEMESILFPLKCLSQYQLPKTYQRPSAHKPSDQID